MLMNSKTFAFRQNYRGFKLLRRKKELFLLNCNQMINSSCWPKFNNLEIFVSPKKKIYCKTVGDMFI